MHAAPARLVLALTVGALLSTGAPTAMALDPGMLRQGAARLAADHRLVLAQASDPRQLAMALDRLNGMEQELRSLRGQIEQLEYNQRQLQARLAEIERSGTGPVAQGAAEPNPTPIVPPMTSPSNPQRGQVVGTLPREAVMGGSPPPTGLAQQQAALPTAPAGSYAAAREFLNRGDTTNAEAAFRRFLEERPNDPEAAQAAYILGDLYLARGAWQEAAATFAKNYQGYGPDSPRAADNLLKLGVALARGGETAKACQTFTELQRRYPNANPAILQALSRERATAACG